MPRGLTTAGRLPAEVKGVLWSAELPPSVAFSEVIHQKRMLMEGESMQCQQCQLVSVVVGLFAAPLSFCRGGRGIG